MKTLKEYTILYDQDCPMCKLYTKAFVQTKMLDDFGRQPYQELTSKLQPFIDCKRAVNEIALVNTQTGEVEYGVKSLFLILQNSFPMLKALFRSRTFFWFADKAYKFVSYNRRVIVPSQVRKDSFLNEPSFHLYYRLAYLTLTWFITASILNAYTESLVPLIPASSFYREFAICGGQILWQAIAIQLVAPIKSWDYLGNLMTISVVGALLLQVVNGVAAITDVQHPYFFAVGFGLVVLLMFLEHIRRSRILRISWLMTLSWVVYRLLVLLVIL